MKLRESEKLLHELHPEKRTLFVWFLTKVIWRTLMSGFFTFWFFGMLGLIVTSASSSDPQETFVSMGLASAGIMIVALFLNILHTYFEMGTFRYYITTERCIFQGGILRYRERSIPYHKITDVERSRNLLERFLGLSSIRIFTPGTSSAFAWGVMLGGGQTPELN